MSDMDWMDAASCKGKDGRWWFRQASHKEHNPVRPDPYTAAAKRVCAGCPVVDDCLRFALVTDERHGVWGGLTTEERDARRVAVA